MKLFFNEELVEADQIRVLSSEGYNFGYGVFETIKVYRGKLVFFDSHIGRLKRALGLIDIDFDYEIEGLRKKSESIIKENGIEDGAVKILVSKLGESSDLVISTRESVYHEDVYNRGFKLLISNMRRNPKSIIPYIKSTSYMENIIERTEAKRRGYDDCLFLNINGFIAETSISNIFLVEGNTVKTPKIDVGILDGIVRSRIIDITRELGYELEEGEFRLEEVLSSEEAFITNSLMGVMPVASIEDKFYNLNKNSKTNSIRREYEKIMDME